MSLFYLLALFYFFFFFDFSKVLFKSVFNILRYIFLRLWILLESRTLLKSLEMREIEITTELSTLRADYSECSINVSISQYYYIHMLRFYL